MIEESARVTVIIPTLDRCDLLESCLRSLEGQTFGSFRVLVVDDGSTEDIAAYLREAFPEVDCLRLEANRGFACGVNAGLGNTTTDYAMLLNNDMVLAPDCLAKLVVALDEDATLSAAGPLMLCKDEPERVYSAGDGIRRGGRPESIGHLAALADVTIHDGPFGLSAGAALYRRSVFEEIGYFDERFVAYFEDADWGFRARLAGYGARLLTEARAYHSGSASLNGRHLWRAQQCYRNHALLVVKNFPLGVLVRNARFIFAERIHQARRLVAVARCEVGLVRGVLVWLTTAVGTLCLLPGALVERRRIQSLRVVSNDELTSIMKSEGRVETEAFRAKRFRGAA